MYLLCIRVLLCVRACVRGGVGGGGICFLSFNDLTKYVTTSCGKEQGCWYSVS